MRSSDSFRPIYTAREAPQLSEPKVRPLLLSGAAAILPLYLRLALSVDEVSLLDGDKAVEAYRSFQEGKCRLIAAFRHPYGEEPQLFAHFFLNVLPAEARRLGKPLEGRTHVHFVHGYEVPLWGGPLIRWLLPRSGAVPVHHSKLDSVSLRRIREIAATGRFPLALAPEGQTSYSSDSVPRLERGFAHIAAWALRDLGAAGRDLPVLILPLSIHYRYRDAQKSFDAALEEIEAALGLEPDAQNQDQMPAGRLARAGKALLEAAEELYRKEHRNAYLQGGAAAIAAAAADGSLNSRWAAVLGAALTTAESVLGLEGSGDTVQRVYRIRHECWDRIYPPRSTEPQPPLSRALADRNAGEAWYAMRHMELADLGYYLDFDGLSEQRSPDLLAERASNLCDLVNRLRGGDFSKRRVYGRRSAVIVPGSALNLGSLVRGTGSELKGSMETAEGELKKAYESCIMRFRKEYPNG